MKVLICVKKNPTQRFLVNLLTESLINEIRELISNHQHSKAVVTAFAKGSIERELSEVEAMHVDVDLILSERNARWDLCKSIGEKT